jgi:osmoprotectant transport system permease protein
VGKAEPVIVASTTSINGTWSYITGHWSGSGGIFTRLGQHLAYSGEALAVSLVIGIPIGLWCGHTGRGGAILSSIGNASRALPTLGLVIFLAVLINVGLTAAVIPLLFLAIAPILSNTYVSIQGVDRNLVDAARGMGMSESEILFRVQVPVALPVITLGVRAAALQVVATATIVADVGLGGLGRYIIDGIANKNFAEVGAGAVLVAALAVIVEAILILAQRLVVSPGLRARPTN